MKVWTRLVGGTDRRDRVELVALYRGALYAGAVLLTGRSSPWAGTDLPLYQRESEARTQLRQIARRTVAVIKGAVALPGEVFLPSWGIGTPVPLLELPSAGQDIERSLVEDGFVAAEVDE